MSQQQANTSRDFIRISSRPPLNVILEACAFHSGYAFRHIMGPDRHRIYIRVRFVYYYIARTMGKRSFPQIGKFLGGRDHTTVMNGYNRVKNNPTEFEPLLSEVRNGITMKYGCYQIEDD